MRFYLKYLFFSWDPGKAEGQLTSAPIPCRGSISGQEDLPFSLPDWRTFGDLFLPWELSLHPCHVEAFIYFLIYFPFHVHKFIVWPEQSSFFSSTQESGNSKKWLVGTPLHIIVLKLTFKNTWAKKWIKTNEINKIKISEQEVCHISVLPLKCFFKWRGKALFPMVCCGHLLNCNGIFSNWEWGNSLLHPDGK